MKPHKRIYHKKPEPRAELATKKLPPITDHALVRWLERVYGLNVDHLRDQIMTNELRTAIKMGARTAMIDNVEYVIENQRVVTVRRMLGE